MHAVVLLHEGLDPAVDVEPVEPAGARHRGGPDVVVLGAPDRAALECALALATRVTALTVAPPGTRALAHALARGVARAIRVWDRALDAADVTVLARVVAAACGALAADVVLAGHRGLAGGSGALPGLVAARLGWPCLDDAGSLARERAALVAGRRLPGGHQEEAAVDLPAVVGVTAEAAAPRYVSVTALRRAERRGHETWDLAALGLDPAEAGAWPRARVERVDWPRPRARRTARPVSAGSAADRMRALMGGGRAATAPPETGSAASRVVDVSPGEAAERVIAFLRARGLLG